MDKITLPNVVAAGIYNAEVAIRNRSVSKNRKTTMFEIELPIEKGGVSYVDEEVHQIDTDTVILAKPGQLRHTRLPVKCHYVHIIINDGKLYEELVRLPNFIKAKQPSRMRELFEKMCECYASYENADELMLQSYLLELIYLLITGAPNGNRNHKAKNNNHLVIENVIEYIKKNPTSELSLAKISNEAKFTPTYFHRLFKASTGKTLRDFVEEERIKKSVNMLLSTNLTLTQIAYECGFCSQSYFSYAFKKRMGLPPREYAKKLHRSYGE